MKISLDDLEKVDVTESTTFEGVEIDPDESLTAIIKVNEADYVPKDVQVRARIDSNMITGSFPAKSLKKLQSDPKVESLSLPERLQMIE